MDSKQANQSAGIPAVGGEFRSLKQHGSATMSELREFVASMRGKSAKEMLGAVAESGLVRATIQATLGCVVLMGIFTAGPYFAAGGKAEAKSAAAKPADSKDKQENAAPAQSSEIAADSSTEPTTKTTAEKTAKTNPGDPLSPDDLDKAAKKLGIGETKSADPKVNPLDKDLDLLLDKK